MPKRKPITPTGILTPGGKLSCRAIRRIAEGFTSLFSIPSIVKNVIRNSINLSKEFNEASVRIKDFEKRMKRVKFTESNDDLFLRLSQLTEAARKLNETSSQKKITIGDKSKMANRIFAALFKGSKNLLSQSIEIAKKMDKTTALLNKLAKSKSK